MTRCAIESKLEAIFGVSAVPDEALSDWERFNQSFKNRLKKKFSLESPNAGFFLKIFGNSSFLARFATRWPELVEPVLQSPFLKKEKPEGEFKKELGRISETSLEPYLRQVRLYKYSELLRITLKDLAGIAEEVVLRELSFLALAVLFAVDSRIYADGVKSYGIPRIAENGSECPYHILALGKLGGRELNYSSDVDLVMVSKTEDGSAGLLSLHEFFVRHAQVLTAALQTRTEEGFLYRVDWDLRPEGRAGTLVNSLSAMESYYENFGSGWERQALTKLSPGTGSREVFSAFREIVDPFVYRKSLDHESIRSVVSMKQKIHEDMAKKAGSGFHVKLGVGGIREIEFFAQAFLLVFGGQKPELRHAGTLEVISRLAGGGFVSPNDAAALKRDYLFLRKLEHRLQLADEAQTHTVPPSTDEQKKIARRMGYADKDPGIALARFQSDLREATKHVQHMFSNLLSDGEANVFSHSGMAYDEALTLPKNLRERVFKCRHFEERLDEIRLFKKEKTGEIRSYDNKPGANRREILFKLSVVAESVCRVALELAIEELKPVYGTAAFQKTGAVADEAHLVPVAMGKMGGCEINYFSDLDMIFIFSNQGQTTGPKTISNSEYFARVVQKFISILSVSTRAGSAWSIDAELRPSGNAGLLVTSLESFFDYQRKVSQIWERQALIKARPLAGSAYWANLVRGQLETFLYGVTFPDSIRTEIDRLRMRVEKEVSRETPSSFDYKLGYGAMMDIEFILQFEQLRLGVNYPQLRTANTFEGLDALITLNLLHSEEDAILLKEAYTFYRTLESKITLRMNRKVSRIEAGSTSLKETAKDLDLGSEKELMEVYKGYSSRVREVYLKIFRG